MLLEIIRKIDLYDWNSAKELWITNFMGINKKLKEIDLYGSENAKFFQYIKDFQKHEVVQQCRQDCNFNGFILNRDEHYVCLNKINNVVFADSMYGGMCPSCRTTITAQIRFSYFVPNFFLLNV